MRSISCNDMLVRRGLIYNCAHTKKLPKETDARDAFLRVCDGEPFAERSGGYANWCIAMDGAERVRCTVHADLSRDDGTARSLPMVAAEPTAR